MAQWRQWQVELPGKPEIVRILGEGLSNHSYLLKAGENRMVLRINNNDGQLPGIDHQREAMIWRAASEAGIAPALLHAGNRYLVSSFVPDETFSPDHKGSSWTPEAQARENCTANDLADQVFGLIEKCHAIKIDTQQLDYAQHIQSYWAKIEQSAIAQSGTEQTGKLIDPALINQRQAMQESLQALSAQQQESVLCHHDPVMANFVGSPKRLYLIDWEYAAKGMAVMDYAALAVEWGFSDATICARTNIRLDSLVMAKKLYRYMCLLWAMAQSEPSPAS